MKRKKFWGVGTYKQREDPKACCVCGGKAIYKWNKHGWCSLHKDGAVQAATAAAMRRPTPHLVDDLRLYSAPYVARQLSVERRAVYTEVVRYRGIQ